MSANPLDELIKRRTANTPERGGKITREEIEFIIREAYDLGVLIGKQSASKPT